MNKKIPIAVLLVATALVLVVMWKRAGDESTKPSAKESAASRPVATGPGSATDAPRMAVRDGTDDAPGETTSADEERVLVMYEEIGEAFTSHRGHCNAMGTAISEVLDSHADAFGRLRAERATMSADELRAVDARLERVHGERLAQLRDTMKQTVAACKDSPQLMNALRRLSS